jgi:diguanylate cyclase (GGDEF)-like protein
VLTLMLQVGAGMGLLKFPELSNALFMASHAFAGLLTSLGMAHQVLGYRDQRDVARSHAERDPLTGALNRRAAASALQSALSTLEHGRGSVAVCFLDLDYFKRVNDSFGHHIGDEALKFLVREVEHEMRATDLLARMGGEEFLVVMPGAHLKDGMALAERIRAAVETHGAVIAGKSVALTISIGVAASTTKLNDADALINAADAALYRAKQRGRNRVETLDLVEINRLKEQSK